MTKEALREQSLSYHKEFIKNIFADDFLNLKDGFSKIIQFLISIIVFAVHLLILPVLISISLIKYFRWKYDCKYQDKMWEIYQKELKEKEEKLFNLNSE